MSCRAARRRIDASLERELGLEARLALEAHLACCGACAHYERQARLLQEWLEGPGDPPPTAPDVAAAAAAVFARLEQGSAGSARPRRSRRPALALGGALALAAGLALALPWLERSVPPPVAAPAAPSAGGWTAASVEAAVRAALLECFGTGGIDEDRARERYLERVRDPARAGWPVRRFVEGLLEDPQPAVARAAVRCLGAGGEPGAAPALERVLARAELAEEALEALGSLGLLGDAGEPALAVLERALGVPALAPHALLELCRVGGARCAGILERAAEAARDDSSPSREALLDALTATGAPAVASLLRLAARRSEPDWRAAILARLPLVAGAGPELARILSEERLPAELAYPALASLQPAEALAWLEERCAETRERPPALETLAGFAGPAPLASALRLGRGGRVPREDVLALLVELLEREGERAEVFTHALVAGGEAAALHAWLALLIDSRHPAAARALVPLVFAAPLPNDDRQRAALAVGELGSAREAEALARALEGQLADDRRLGAACLLSIHAWLGAPAVERLLAHGPASGVRRVLAALDGRRSGEAVRVHRVARALEGALAASSTDEKAIL